MQRQRPIRIKIPARRVATRRTIGTQTRKTLPLRRRITRVGFPKTMKLKHRYVAEISIDPAAGAFAYHNFSCNGLYDPDITGVGHQPYYFDTMSSLYDHYTVIASNIKVTFASNSTTVSPGYMGIYKADGPADIGTFSDITGILEGPGNDKTKWMIVGDQLVANPNNRHKTAKMRWSAKKDLGISHPMSEPDLRGSSAANPAEQTYYSVFVADIAGNDPGAIKLLVEIEYVAVWTERHTIAQS